MIHNNHYESRRETARQRPSKDGLRPRQYAFHLGPRHPSMLSDDSRNRLVLMSYGLLILLAPVVFLFLTLGFLTFTGDLVLSQLTLLEFVELYVLELIVVVAFGYGIYRLTLWVAESRLPVLLDALDADDVVDDERDDDDRF